MRTYNNVKINEGHSSVPQQRLTEPIKTVLLVDVRDDKLHPKYIKCHQMFYKHLDTLKQISIPIYEQVADITHY